MANTYTDYTATSNETSFSYGFTALLAAHVAVEINGVAKTYNTDYTVDKATSVVTLQLGGIVGTGATAGDIVRLRRRSDPSNDLVDFADGSRLSASRLDLAYQHNRFLNEEASEISDGAIGETTIAGVAFLDATAREIRNISAPTTNTSAVTKQYVDDQQALSGTNMTAFGADNYTGDGTTLAFNFFNISPQITDSKAFLVNIDGITQNPSSFTITTTGITFQTAPVTSSKISVLTLAGAAITAPVDGVTTELKTGNKIGVKNGGISNIHLEGNIGANKLAGGIQNTQLAGGITNAKLAGSIATSKLAEVIDDDTMTTGVSSTSLASSESIKAYVDTKQVTTNEYVDAQVAAAIAAIPAKQPLAYLANNGSVRSGSTYFFKNYSVLTDVDNILSFSDGNMSFAATGTYLVEVSGIFTDSDTTQQDTYHLGFTSSTSSTTALSGFTNFGFTSAAKAFSSQIVRTVSNTSTDKLAFRADPVSNASSGNWQSVNNTMRVTKLT